MNGSAARDVASHFVQRWNHHRSSTSQYSEPILRDICDNFFFSQCARCKQENIIETALTCPKCQYDLGPCNSYSRPLSPTILPPPISEHSYVVIEAAFGLTIPFKIGGDCPVIVTHSHFENGLTATNIISRDIIKGHSQPRIVEAVGPQAKYLTEHPDLSPAVGDVVFKVDGVEVTHLDCLKVKRFFKLRASERKKVIKAHGTASPILILFRRHYRGESMPFDEVKAVPIDETNVSQVKAVDAFNTNTNAPVEVTIVESMENGKNESKSAEPQRRLSVATAASPTVSGNGKDAAPDSPMDKSHTLICQSVARMEQLLNMSLLTHLFAKKIELIPRIFDGTGTCHVQVLANLALEAIFNYLWVFVLTVFLYSMRN